MHIYDPAKSSNSKKLLALVAQGDKAAFKILYESYSEKIFSFAYRILNDTGSAEEVIQEIMLKIWLMGNKLNDIDHLDSFIRTMSRNYCYSLLRREQLKKNINIYALNSWSQEEDNAEVLILAKEQKTALNNAVDNLPIYYKKVYKLCYQDGMKYDDLAKTLQLSPHTVKTYMKHALRSIRKSIVENNKLIIMLINTCNIFLG